MREQFGVLRPALRREARLERAAVFLFGVSDGLIPLRGADGSCDADEERRLLYVGLTRAKDELVLLADEKEPSPFLSDIPAGALVKEKKRRNAGKQLGFL